MELLLPLRRRSARTTSRGFLALVDLRLPLVDQQARGFADFGVLATLQLGDHDAEFGLTEQVLCRFPFLEGVQEAEEGGGRITTFEGFDELAAGFLELFGVHCRCLVVGWGCVRTRGRRKVGGSEGGVFVNRDRFLYSCRGCLI